MKRDRSESDYDYDNKEAERIKANEKTFMDVAVDVIPHY